MEAVRTFAASDGQRFLSLHPTLQLVAHGNQVFPELLERIMEMLKTPRSAKTGLPTQSETSLEIVAVVVPRRI
ncbi:MAG: hypothetical protein ACK56I_00945, partial [bacterium]